MAIRFIHTADLHLLSSLKALRRRNVHLADAVGVAMRTAFERIVERAIEEKVVTLLIAGDLYDSTSRDVSKGLCLTVFKLKPRTVRFEVASVAIHGSDQRPNKLMCPRGGQPCPSVAERP